MNLRPIADHCEKYRMLPRSGLVLAAVSGGRDSMCMLHVLHALSEAHGFTLEAVHFNHCLRGAESDGDEAFVRRVCEALSIPCHVGSGDAAAFAAQTGKGIEDGARALRYGFFDDCAEALGAVRVATAHTADDNTETVLLHLIRGSGLQGLGGIPPVRGIYIRPMLCVTRSWVDGYINENNIEYREDSSNVCDDFARNRLRHQVLPVLKTLNPSVCDTVSAAAALLRADEAYLSAKAESFLRSQASGGCSAKALCALEAPIASRAVRQRFGPELSRVHVDSVLALAASDDPSGSVSLPGCTVRREYDLLTALPVPAGFAPVTLSPGETKSLPGTGLTVSCAPCGAGEIIHNSFTTFFVDSDIINGSITVRPRQAGDRLHRVGHPSQTLKKLFIDTHLPALRRALVPVVSDESGVLAVYGFGTDIRAASHRGGVVLKITFEEKI